MIKKLNSILSNHDSAHSKIEALKCYMSSDEEPANVTEDQMVQFKKDGGEQQIILDEKEKKLEQLTKLLDDIGQTKDEQNFKKLHSNIMKLLKPFKNLIDITKKIEALKFNATYQKEVENVRSALQKDKKDITLTIDTKVLDQIIKNKILEDERSKFISSIQKCLEEIVDKTSSDILYQKFIGLLKKQINFKETFKEILAKALFKLDQPFENDKARDTHFNSLKDKYFKAKKDFKDEYSIYEYLTKPEQDHTVKNDPADQQVSTIQSSKKSPLVDRLKTLLNKLEGYVEQIQENQNKLYTLSCEFIVERIGDVSEKLARSKHFPETDYLSLSKYQLIILNASRKALAHHPLEIGDAKLRYFIEQLVMEARHKIKETIFEGDYVNDILIEHKSITIELLEDTKYQIQHLVIKYGFNEEFFLYSLDYGCNIGVQGDLNLVVIPIDKNTKYTDLFSLELALTKLLQAEVKVFNFNDFRTLQTRKISFQHQEQLTEIEEFSTFVTTEKFRYIYNSEQWISVKIGATTYYKDQSNITETAFIQASSVDYIYTQHMFDMQKRDTEQFRSERINNVNEIRKIIEEKAELYLKNLLHGVDQLKISLSNDLELLKLFLVQDKELDLVIDKYFYSHREGILKAEYVDGIVNFRAQVKTGISNNGSFSLIQEKEFLQHAVAWKDLFQKLPINLKHIVQKLEMFFCEVRNPQIIEQIFNVNFDRTILQNSLIEDLEKLFCEDDAVKSTSLVVPEYHMRFSSSVNCIIRITEPFLIRQIDIGAREIILHSDSAKIEFQKPQFLKDVTTSLVSSKYIKVDFASEVEYAYYETYHKQLANINTQNPGIFKLIKQIVNDDSIKSNIRFDYEVPYISGGILGYGSELKRSEELFKQIQFNCHTRTPLKPDLTIDSVDPYAMYINAALFITAPENKGTMRFNSKLKNFQDALEFYKMDKSKSAKVTSQDQDDIGNYYKFREIYDHLKTYLLRLNTCYLEYNKLENLLYQECNQQIKYLYGKRIDQVIQEAVFDLDQISTIFKELFITSYVQERVQLVLQNPFKLQEVINFVHENYEDDVEVLCSILQSAKYKIHNAVIEELIENLTIEASLCNLFIDNLSTKYVVESIEAIAPYSLNMHMYDNPMSDCWL